MKTATWTAPWSHKSQCIRIAFFSAVLLPSLSSSLAQQASADILPVQACVLRPGAALNPQLSKKIAHCLRWEEDRSVAICQGRYQGYAISPIPGGNIQIHADKASLYVSGQSKLMGHVEIQETDRIVTADTAYLYRDPKTKQLSRIEFLGEVYYQEADKLLIARRAEIYPGDKTGRIEDVLYRFAAKNPDRAPAAWGQASLVQRFSNQDYRLEKVSYTTCPPGNNAWRIQADSIELDHAKQTGVAKNAKLTMQDWPVLYSPYLSFPTSNARKSGFLVPVMGYSNIGGFDFGLPYYLNLAPNYDATLLPHYYSLRGLMLGGDFRYLSPGSQAVFRGSVLPQDQAFKQFIKRNEAQFPSLRNASDDRWSIYFRDRTLFSSALVGRVNFQQVSDDYYLQDFSTDLSVLTQNQLLRQGDLTLNTDHWLLSGMVQSYQTLHPINQSIVADIYQRLPELKALGTYRNLPFHADFSILTQFDYFLWPNSNPLMPRGPRYHLNPILALPQVKPWGHFTPSIQLVQNYYTVDQGRGRPERDFNRSIPRYNLDAGLVFDRASQIAGRPVTQTFEPRFNYLYVPYHNQSQIPVYDSAYMIFNYDQLYRSNRFSGFDRIGDTNQLSYGFTSRLLLPETGQEKMSFSLGQISYFANRRVRLCYQRLNTCFDQPETIGYLSPTAQSSPIASRLNYALDRNWSLMTDYIWDPATRGTNNADINFHFQPNKRQILNFGYSYLVDGDNTLLPNRNLFKRYGLNPKALNQATVATAWPLSDRFSVLGIYGYNLSKQFNMLSYLGLQYDNCCWALRFFGGQSFKSLNPNTARPQYNSNLFLQLVLKGLGSAATGNPTSTIQSYLPGYDDIFNK